MKKGTKILIGVLGVIALVAIVILAIKLIGGDEIGFDQNSSGDTQTSNSGDTYEPINYTPLNELPADYTIEAAIKDKCFVNQISGTYNLDILEAFYERVDSQKDANVRIVSVTLENKPIIIDMLFKDGNMTVTEDSTRDDMAAEENRIINVNEYNMTEYTLEKRDEMLDDGEQVVTYYLRETSTSEEITVVAYLEEVSYEEMMPNTFEALISRITPDYLIIEPATGSSEREISDSIQIIIDNLDEDITYEVGNNVSIEYTGGINQIEDIYELSGIVSLEVIE